MIDIGHSRRLAGCDELTEQTDESGLRFVHGVTEMGPGYTPRGSARSFSFTAGRSTEEP